MGIRSFFEVSVSLQNYLSFLNNRDCYTFEPISEPLDTLSKYSASNGLKDVNLYNLAVSDRVDNIFFYSDSIIPKKDVGKLSVKTTNMDTFLAEKKVNCQFLKEQRKYKKINSRYSIGLIVTTSAILVNLLKKLVF